MINSKRSDILNAINEIDSQRWLESSKNRINKLKEISFRKSYNVKSDVLSDRSIDDVRETMFINSVNSCFQANYLLQ